MKKYLITSKEFYTDTPAVFRKILHEQFVKYLPEYALYRDKSNPNYATQAEHFTEVCAQFMDVKSFIHSDADLAKKLGADGVHLTSSQFSNVEYALSLGLEVIISCHTHEEVLIAEKSGVNMVTYSPIFSTPGKGEPKGIEDLEALLEVCKVKVFALGGIISQVEVEAVENTTAYGFASIRYFY